MPHRVVVLCCLALALAACSSSSSLSAPEAGLFTEQLERHPVQTAAERPETLPLTTTRLRDTTLDPLSAQQLALVGSPRVRVALAGLGVSGAERAQASLLANPGFSIKAISPEGDASWKTELALNVGLLDWLLRPLREQIAQSEYAASQLLAWREVRDALLEVQQAYLEAVASRQRAAVMADMAHVARLNADLASAMREAGNLSELATLRHLAAADERQRQAAAAAEAAASAQRRLTRLMGLPADTAFILPAALPLPESSLPALQPLLQHGLAQRVELSLLRRQQQALLDEQRRVARQAGISSVELGLVAERERGGDWHPGLRAGLQLPLFDRGQAQQAALTARWQQLEAEHDAVALDIETEILDALGIMQVAQQQASQLYEEEIPRWQRMIELALREYNFMLTGTFDLLTVKQQSLDAMQAHIDSLLDYWRARAALDLASANALEHLPWDSESQPSPATDSQHHGGHIHD